MTRGIFNSLSLITLLSFYIFLPLSSLTEFSSVTFLLYFRGFAFHLFFVFSLFRRSYFLSPSLSSFLFSHLSTDRFSNSNLIFFSFHFLLLVNVFTFSRGEYWSTDFNKSLPFYLMYFDRVSSLTAGQTHTYSFFPARNIKTPPLEHFAATV